MNRQAVNWVARLRTSIEANLPQPFFFTLCTVGLDGTPRGRTVVSRELTQDQDGRGVLVVCTNTTSEKWSELSRNPNFEICCYFATSREQFRLRGSEVQFFRPPSPEAEAVWTGMTDSAKSMFINPATKETENFGVISFKPNTVQLLETATGTITNWDKVRLF